MQIANDFTALTTTLVWEDESGAPRPDITYGFATETYSHHRSENVKLRTRSDVHLSLDR